MPKRRPHHGEVNHLETTTNADYQFTSSALIPQTQDNAATSREQLTEMLLEGKASFDARRKNTVVPRQGSVRNKHDSTMRRWIYKA